MNVRLAQPGDLEVFLHLVEDYLLEMASFGSEVLLTGRTMAFWLRLFETYVLGDGPGVIVMADTYGFTAAGSVGEQPFDTSFGQCATGWGTYVVPSMRNQHIANELRTIARTVLIAKGFDTLIGGVHVNNAAGLASARRAGFVPLQIMGYSRLVEVG